jgi:hypothetical protein
MKMRELITDPELGARPIDFERITEIVDDKGRAVLDTVRDNAVGIVQPAPGEELERLPDADRGKDSIMVFITARLTAGRDDQKPDRVLHDGKRYRVSLAEFWPGDDGYTKAVAVLEEEAPDA